MKDKADKNTNRRYDASASLRPSGAGVKRYRAPQLIDHGDVRDMTLGGSGTSGDTGSNQVTMP